MDRDQAFLLPPSMTDWLPGDHLVWFVIDAVGELDTAGFHGRARLGGAGRRGYDPDMLLTLLVYAMAGGVRSSRQIERLCRTDVAFRIICAGDVPDHTVLARFRQTHEQALADLLTASLVLAARLGMVRLGVVAFDGTKIAAAASKAANRSEDGLRRIAERHLAETAATDTAEDALFGGTRGDELPEKLRDRSGRGSRIRQALQEIEKANAARLAREQQQQQNAADYQRQITEPGPGRRGKPPRGVDPVAAAYDRWQRERSRAQQRIDDFDRYAAAETAAGRRPRRRRPPPADTYCRVIAAKNTYETTKTTTQTSNNNSSNGNSSSNSSNSSGEETAPRANLTDPDSRLMKTRNGYIQGYNCQTALSADQFFLEARGTQDTNDRQQFAPTCTALDTTLTHLASRTGRTDLTIGTLLGDAGYDSTTNLALPGPDRLIPATSTHKLAQQPTPPTGTEPPEHATTREHMNHRLTTPEGRQLYKQRSPTVEAPNGWLKDRRNLRQFLRRGLTAINSELRFACAVTNLLRIHTLTTT